MPTYTPKPEEVTRTWRCIDADGKVLGRLATEVASLLRGKHKPTFSYHVDVGDFVVIVNAAKVVTTSNKAQQIKHYRHSGYPGGLKERLLAHELESRPEEVVRRAVKGMLPHNRLGRQMLKKLKVYAGPEHPHEAQFKGTPGAPNSRRAEKDAKKQARQAAAKTSPATEKAPTEVEEPTTTEAIEATAIDAPPTVEDAPEAPPEVTSEPAPEAATESSAEAAETPAADEDSKE